MFDKRTLSIETVAKRVRVALVNLIWQETVNELVQRKVVWQNELLENMQRMFFSEKSSFAQSGIFVSCAVEKIVSSHKTFFHPEHLRDTQVDLIVACGVDTLEHPFLQWSVRKICWKVGRLLPPRKQVDRAILKDRKRVGAYTDDPNKLEVVIGDSTLGYPEPQVDESGALIIALCPTTVRSVSGEWNDTNNIKGYQIVEAVVKRVLEGWSRIALSQRPFTDIDYNASSLVGRTDIFEIPLDIWPYDADIEVVCQWPHGEYLNIIHFPATYLDAVRTFPDGENRVQVEIKNIGVRDVPFKNIFFRVRLYETDNDTRERWEVRRALQDAERWQFHAIEHLVYSQVLRGDETWSIARHMSGLGDLANIDNLFCNWIGLFFYQHEAGGKLQDCCEIISEKWMESLDDVRVYGYQKDFISVLKRSCSIGREKRKILVCRNDISMDEIQRIAQLGLTDIVSIPGKNAMGNTVIQNALKPCKELLHFCKTAGIKLTSIDVLTPATKEEAQFDLVGAKRSQ